MPPTVGKIIRKDQVRLAGSCRIGDASAARGRGEKPAQVRVIGQTDDSAVIEVACSCGKRIQIRCALGAPSVPAGARE